MGTTNNKRHEAGEALGDRRLVHAELVPINGVALRVGATQPIKADKQDFLGSKHMARSTNDRDLKIKRRW